MDAIELVCDRCGGSGCLACTVMKPEDHRRRRLVIEIDVAEWAAWGTTPNELAIALLAKFPGSLIEARWDD